jgi:transposase
MTQPTESDEGSPASEPRLFDDLEDPSAQKLEVQRVARAARRQLHPPRLREPNRQQVELRASDLESLLGQDHRARLVWGYVVLQDLSSLYDAVKSRGSGAGRAAIDPRVLFALWLYATLEGVGSGRELTRLSQEHDAYRWICGGVPVNYHALNDFRSANEALMDSLLTSNVAALAAAGAISLDRVAQDGMRVRADAGAASFRRKASLQEHLAEAAELIAALKEQAQSDPTRPRRQAQAAQLRAAEQREQRIRDALAQLPEVVATKKRNGGREDQARASTTDAQARVMKMGDGGYRPAYNVQFATTCAEQVIVGTEVVNLGSDMAQLAPMVQQLEQRLGEVPRQWLVDGGFPAHQQIDAVASKTEVYAPVPEPRPAKTAPAADQARREEPKDPPDPPGSGSQVNPLDKHQRKAGDSDAVAQWRQRMATAEAAEIYKQRAATAECVNALARNRGLLRMPVRGLVKVKAVVGLFVLAHNLLRMAVIAPALVGWRHRSASDFLSGAAAV